MTKAQDTEWEREFDEKFVQKIEDDTKIVAFFGNEEGEKYYDFWQDYTIKSFIRQTLASQKSALLEEIERGVENMRFYGKGGKQTLVEVTHNRVINRVLSLLHSLEK